MPQSVNLLEILLVEDDAADARFATEALRRAKVQNRVFVVQDGVEAMQFLRKQGPFEDVPTPDVVLLDLRMPRMDGTEVLETMRRDPELSSMPVAFLTGMDDEALLGRLDGHVQCILKKPLDMDRFAELVLNFEHFAIGFVRSPADGARAPARLHAGLDQPTPARRRPREVVEQLGAAEGRRRG